MKLLSYIMFFCAIMINSGGWPFLTSRACGDAISKNDEDVLLASAAEEQEETVAGANEIRIRKDEFDEIVGQLQGMKAFLENMKQDYDIRFKEMQEKIATLEKEKTALAKEVTQTAKRESPSGVIIKTPETEVKEEGYVKKEDYDAVAGKLQEMESAFEHMESKYNGQLQEIQKTYDSRLDEMQQKVAVSPQPASPEAGTWSPEQPITLWSMGKSYMNISFDGLFAAAGSTAEDLETLETGGHDPNQRGFTVQNLETTFEGAVDPYFKGQANIVYQIDNDGESFLEVEEAFLTSMSLPLNLQVKAGTFFTEFGRLNQFHPHGWDFADQPLVNGRFFGPDGLRNPGARLSWLAPTDNYTELFITVQDSQGDTAYSFRNEDTLFGREAVETRVRGMEDMLYTPRATTSFDVTDETTVLFGASAAFGPNSTGRDKDTMVYGLDMFWKWKSRYASGGFPFVTWQTEVMGRRFEAGEDINAGLPDEIMDNWGAYSQIAWGFKKRWVTGLRGDYVDGEEGATDPLGYERWRLSPNLTFYASEFSKIRLQYNYDDILGNDSTEHSVFLQFEFLLGSHGAHKF
ncbi:MAG: hypothetical protein DCC43_02725 [Candidatus Brocadia sp.]|uniref:Uncharacterized protein n=1 Tax=Candidatus Brocadia fulgida TaxID=380242 RepID=A0A0M2UVD8_9BACT|nr:MAG: hypothetical protein BROFUL_01295 [Candidatus Brocadia fulgida]MCC6324523.1 hypothetical protein [Candidatus Brocadia sp.]MCE7911062.1 hypothetical protein [Candidatus Brocadia sp. AMX3]MBV6519523.1 hypothetical protein [Candidatus Brocadia fulgida]MDG5997018.1 hypothetical protein [Candidatus Brocadia sp.]